LEKALGMVEQLEKIVYIIAGPNGCGKSTLANELIEEQDMPFLNADQIAEEIAGEQSIEQVRVTAGKIFFRRLDEYISDGKSFAIESTLSGRYLVRFIEKLKKSNYTVNIKYVYIASPEEAISRIRCRVLSGGHHIPDEDVVRRFGRSVRNFWYLYKDMADFWEIWFNGADAVNYVAVLKDNQIKVTSKELFEQFMEMLCQKK
jgi:predicted ABC-type ATPase